LSADITNLGLAVESLQVDYGNGKQIDGDVLAFSVSERHHGGVDLNADGDTYDHVMHVFDAAAGTTLNLGLASYDAYVDNNLVAFAVSEQRSGEVDLNDDGDTGDAVLHVYDASSGTLTNLGFSTYRNSLWDAGRLAFVANEADNGDADLNGDGDTADEVLHLFDATSGTITNIGLEGSRGFQLDGDILLINVSESRQGNTDLNGDGDASDKVLHVYDAHSGNTTNLGISTHSFELEGNLLHLELIESQHGDLNGDGDTADLVPQIRDVLSGTTIHVGLAGTGELSGDLLALAVDESQQNNTDLNGDGDTEDTVIHVFDAGTGTTTNLGLLAPAQRFQWQGSLLAIQASEDNADLNGDGDMADLVFHVYDASTGTTTNIGLTGSGQLSGHLLAIEVFEPDQGGTDLNGDGDVEDPVLHVYDANTGITTNVAVSGYDVAVGGNLVAIAVEEYRQGRTDLNGDGDLEDHVLQVYNASEGTTTNLGLSTRVDNYGFMAFRVEANRVVFVVKESLQGDTDLNGDGDVIDNVLHVADFAAPVPIPEQIDDIAVEVQALNDLGILNDDQANPLLNHLKNSLKQYDKDKIDNAVKKLNDFIHRVGDLLDDDVLTLAEAQPLIDAAESLIDELLAL
jgi:hypothetical protein